MGTTFVYLQFSYIEAYVDRDGIAERTQRIIQFSLLLSSKLVNN